MYPTRDRSPIFRGTREFSSRFTPDATEQFGYSNYLRKDNFTSRATYAFSVAMTGSNAVTITGGHFTVHGAFRATVADLGPVSLSGDTCWVYLSCNVSTAFYETPVIEGLVSASDEAPESNASDIYIPLVVCTRIADGVYKIAKIHHEGDVNLGSYIR